jgi:hypothetical protein
MSTIELRVAYNVANPLGIEWEGALLDTVDTLLPDIRAVYIPAHGTAEPADLAVGLFDSGDEASFEQCVASACEHRINAASVRVVLVACGRRQDRIAEATLRSTGASMGLALPFQMHYAPRTADVLEWLAAQAQLAARVANQTLGSQSWAVSSTQPEVLIESASEVGKWPGRMF